MLVSRPTHPEEAWLRLVDVAVVTGLYLASYRLGSALGQTLAGAVWTQRMPLELANRIGNQTVALNTYNMPYVTIEEYPIGTAERDGMVASYAAVQKLLAGELSLPIEWFTTNRQ